MEDEKVIVSDSEGKMQDSKVLPSGEQVPLREPTLRSGNKPISWLSLLLWVLATTVSWGLIPFLILVVLVPVFRVLFFGQTVVDPTELYYALQGAIFGILLGILFGVVIGVLQWLVLRRHISRASWWIAATIAGLALGAALGIVALRPLFTGPTNTGDSPYFIALAALMPGILVGLLQRLVLGYHFERTWWWILPSIMTWPVSLVYLFEGIEFKDASYLVIWGAVSGTLSGISLLLISRKRKESVTRPARATMRRRFSRRAVTAILILVLISVVVLSVTYEFSTRSPRPLLTLNDHTAAVLDVSFSPDGALLASVSGDGTVCIWRAEDGELLHTLEHIGSISVSFSPDGETLASGDAINNTVKLWRVTDGTLLQAISTAGYIVAFSPNGSMLASVGWSQPLQSQPPQFTGLLWSIADGKAIRTLESGHVTEFCNSLAFSPDGTILAGGFRDGVVLMWSVEDGALLHTLTGHDPYCEVYVAFSPDGKTLASGSWDGTIRFWRVDDGAFLHAAAGSLAGVMGIAFSADGSTLAAASMNYLWHFWCAADGQPIAGLAINEHKQNQQSVAFSPDLKTIASGDCIDGGIRIYGIESGPSTEQAAPPDLGLLFPELVIILEDGLEVRTDAGGYSYGYDEVSLDFGLMSAPPQSSEAATRLKEKLESLGAKGVEAGVVGGVIIVDFEQFPFKGDVWQGFFQVYGQGLSGYLKAIPSGD